MTKGPRSKGMSNRSLLSFKLTQAVCHSLAILGERRSGGKLRENWNLGANLNRGKGSVVPGGRARSDYPSRQCRPEDSVRRRENSRQRGNWETGPNTGKSLDRT